jgi:hypothetical protein
MHCDPVEPAGSVTEKEERPVEDEMVSQRINKLAREEHELFERESRGTASD